MYLTWFLTNSSVRNNVLENVIINQDYKLYCNNKESIYKSESQRLNLIIINGYVIPRYKYHDEFKELNQYQLIENIYLKYGERFTNYIKGIFSIVIIDDTKLNIINDQLGIFKLFYYQGGGKYVFSNSSKLVSKFIDKKTVDKTTIAVKSLINREIAGDTLIKGLKYLTPGSCVKISDGEILFTEYWNPSSLLKLKNQGNDFQYFADFIKKSVKQYSEHLQSQSTTISLTGGKDSRTLLAALLNNSIIPFGFTYGNPNSKDAVFAKQIAEKLNLIHKVYNPTLTFEWFEDYAKKIVEMDNPAINIHRSHRLFAFEKLKNELGEETSYYAGYMGGEFLMGIYYDDLIFSKYLTDFWDTGFHGDLNKYLLSHFIKEDLIDKNDLIKKMSGLRSLDHSISKELMKFYSFFEIGIPHHSQDINLASTQINYTVPIFIDIDFLELLFASDYTFFDRNNKTKNLLERYQLYEFNLNIQHILFPEMDELLFAKKGVYNIKEFRKGKYYWSLLKIIRYFSDKRNYSPTFKYNNNYKKFLNKWLLKILSDKNSAINDIYNVDKAVSSLEFLGNLTQEKYFHRYSNIVMHYMQSKYYSL